MQTITEQEVNAGLTQASDAAFINAFTADGTPIKISKADLASVVAAQMGVGFRNTFGSYIATKANVATNITLEGFAQSDYDSGNKTALITVFCPSIGVYDVWSAFAGGNRISHLSNVESSYLSLSLNKNILSVTSTINTNMYVGYILI